MLNSTAGWGKGQMRLLGEGHVHPVTPWRGPAVHLAGEQFANKDGTCWSHFSPATHQNCLFVLLVPPFLNMLWEKKEKGICSHGFKNIQFALCIARINLFIVSSLSDMVLFELMAIHVQNPIVFPCVSRGGDFVVSFGFVSFLSSCFPLTGWQ